MESLADSGVDLYNFSNNATYLQVIMAEVLFIF